jgi:hypothetical protein
VDVLLVQSQVLALLLKGIFLLLVLNYSLPFI